MTNTEIVTLAAAVIALLGSILSLFISTRLAIQKERRQLLWAKELGRFFELEELAGDLVEELVSYRSAPDDRMPLRKGSRRLSGPPAGSVGILKCGKPSGICTTHWDACSLRSEIVRTIKKFEVN
jgi:hypothetical protein